MAKSLTPNIDRYLKDKAIKLEAARKKAEKKINDKLARIKKDRELASKLASKANKRVERLERNGLQNSPAYQGYLKSGGGRFGVKGKDYNEVQAELARLRKFIDGNTSTVRGVNTYLKDMAKNTGIKYKNLTDLRAKADKFFELASKTEQYLNQVEDMSAAIGYEKIWEQINVYVEKNKVDLSNAENTVEDMVKKISDAITEFEKPEQLDFSSVGGNTVWYKLPKA